MSAKLRLEPHLSRPDDFYAALTDAFRGLSPAQSERVSARLILLLANHIGDHEVLAQALRIARSDTAKANNNDDNSG